MKGQDYTICLLCANGTTTPNKEKCLKGSWRKRKHILSFFLKIKSYYICLCCLNVNFQRMCPNV